MRQPIGSARVTDTSTHLLRINRHRCMCLSNVHITAGHTQRQYGHVQNSMVLFYRRRTALTRAWPHFAPVLSSFFSWCHRLWHPCLLASVHPLALLNFRANKLQLELARARGQRTRFGTHRNLLQSLPRSTAIVLPNIILSVCHC